MVGSILAVAHTPSVSLPTATGLTWLFLVLAAVCGARFGWLAPVVIVVLYLVTHSGGSSHGGLNFSGAMLPWILIALACGFIGWQLGGRAILRHLGQREYITRLSSAKGVNSIWKRWFG